MIIGIGSDLLDMRRMDAVLSRQGQKFIDRIFTPHEQTRATERTHANRSYAKMFAAKEAVAKALGTGFGHGVSWHDIEIGRQVGAAPHVELKGNALKIFIKKIPPHYHGVIHLTITDEPPYAQAFAVLSAHHTPPQQTKD